MTAEEIIELRNMELTNQANIRDLWQQTADRIYPYVNITKEATPGVARTDEIYDETPMLDFNDMVSGLKQVLIPSGQLFFAIKVGNSQNDTIQRYISYVTERTHDEIYASNFVTEFDEILRSLIAFGPACMYSEWTPKTGLNYKVPVVGTYQFIENSKKLVDAILVTVQYTAIQAVEEFGDNAGKEVLKAASEIKRKYNKFEYIYYVGPRTVSPNLSMKFSGNMPWVSQVVNVKEKLIVDEGGYSEFPYPAARWLRPANDKDGRGIGTELLPQIKALNTMWRDFIECGNKWNNPAKEVLESFEGTVRVTPGAVNVVREMGSIKAIDQGINGNFPITKDMILLQQDIIHRAFYKNAFSPLEDLTGDRRTTLEIRERVRQTWHKIGPPVARVWYELLEKVITRSILLLIRNGVLQPPPQELQGINFGIEFVGPFALELRSHQAKAFQEWVSIVGEMETIFPGAKDNVDSDDAIVRMGRTYGVNAEDMATEEERDEKRRIRAEQQQAMMATQMAETAGKTYKNATGSPGEGSPAAALMGK